MKTSPHSKPCAFILFALMTANAIAQTHCSESEGELTHFSCKIAGGTKVASLCGGFSMPNHPNTEYIQYRFGKIGKIEFAYPSPKEKSLKKFEGTYFNKYHYLSYMFINDKALYEVELTERYENKKPIISGVINVVIDKKHTQLYCSKPVDIEYWENLIDLSQNTYKSSGEGKDSFSYQYYNRIAK